MEFPEIVSLSDYCNKSHKTDDISEYRVLLTVDAGQLLTVPITLKYGLANNEYYKARSLALANCNLLLGKWARVVSIWECGCNSY